MPDSKALLIVDVQRDFLPGGALAVPQGDEIIEPLVEYAERLAKVSTVVASRDWHPKDHCSFKEQGGLWPPHCVQDTEGAEIDPRIKAHIIHSKGQDAEEYSAMNDELEQELKSKGIKVLFVAGLATEYCVKATVLESLARGFAVVVITRFIKAFDNKDGEIALQDMKKAGAILA